MAIFTGSGVAIVTPFTEDGVDFDAYRRLIEFQIENGTQAIISCGTTGEPSTMSAEEKQAVIECAIKTVAGRVPVIASTGGNNTAVCIEASKAAQAAGADGLLVVTPYYNKATQAGLVAHYNAIADEVDIPIIVYNVPSRTGLNMLPQTFAAIADHPNIAGVKEASGNIAQVGEIARLCQGKLDIYSGEDAIVLPLMSLGGLGVISVVANIAPADMQALCAAALKGDYAEARRLQFKLNPLVDCLFSEVNPIPAKTALGAMGLCSDRLRMPLSPMGDVAKAALFACMKDYGLLS